MREDGLARRKRFEEFIAGRDNLHVYYQERLLFSSREEGIAPLMDYIERFVPGVSGVLIFDRIVGNAAALLLKIALCHEVWSPLGSEAAARTLEAFGIRYHFVERVPYILSRQGSDMCPLEKLSLGKAPEEFYNIYREIYKKTR